ncbi:MAG: thioredoxin family protein [Phycisphaerae bacterium]|nr:thioredoxin family protein [Phycisphaerae bacterium]
MTRFVSVMAVMIAGLWSCTGCATYNWEGDIQRAEQRAQAEKKPLFIFYKSWLDATSNRMLNDVLQKPDVTALFQRSVNCILDDSYGPNKKYMAALGISRTPAVLIRNPDGPDSKREGYVPKDAFVQWAKSTLEKAQAPAPTAKTPPPVQPTPAP